jgi:hypothetical protein
MCCAPSQDRDRIDADLGLGAAVNRVEVRRIVVVEVHANRNPEETAHFGHDHLPLFAL